MSAWAAGFLDGEGCIGLRKSKSRPSKRASGPIIGYYLQVSASGVDPQPLLRLQELFGGKVRPRTGPLKANHRQAWDWNVYGDEARNLLRVTLPFLTTKAEQAVVALEFEGGYQHSGSLLPEDERERREDIRNRLTLLKGRGVAV